MADSQALSTRWSTRRRRPREVLLMSWGVDLDHFRPAESGRAAVRAELGLPEGRIVLSPRSLMPLYNPRVIVEAFELPRRRPPGPPARAQAHGHGPPPIGPLRHPDRVHVVGHVPYERMVEWYQAADVCVSVASSDSSPRSVWEAMATGTPCVVSDLPWVHELIEHERDALVVPIDPGPSPPRSAACWTIPTAPARWRAARARWSRAPLPVDGDGPGGRELSKLAGSRTLLA